MIGLRDEELWITYTTWPSCVHVNKQNKNCVCDNETYVPIAAPENLEDWDILLVKSLPEKSFTIRLHILASFPERWELC